MECPDLVAWVRERCASDVADGALTVISGDEMEIDFATSTATYAGKSFPFPALGSVPQSLVTAGGIENLVRERLGSS
jgi:hypothetical protein